MAQGKFTREDGELLAKGLRKCTKCGVIKPTGQYGYRGEGSGKLQAQCRQCRLATHKAWVSRNRDHYNKKQRDWRKRNGKTREYVLKYNYGMTPQDHALLYAQQNGCCAICGSPVPYDKVATDHSHITGAVRGLLCSACNVFVGWLETRRHLLSIALGYINGEEKDQ